VPSAESSVGGGGIAFDRLLGTWAPHFPRARLFGLTPFQAVGIAEFDEAASGLRVDSRLVDEAAEIPSHYLVVGGPDEPLGLGYALVQIPVASSLGADAARTEVGLPDLRRRLAEAEGQAEGALRVARAQTEEIEELRARLRRAGEARAELDAELARLRRALAEADESVVTITRRTTEEMTSLASRITAGLRAGFMEPGRPASDTARLEAEVAAAAAALSQRDERIAALEADKQELTWQVQELESRAAARPSPIAFEPATSEMSDQQARLREQALDQLRLAAAAHLEETARLRAALGEQATLVAELEEALEESEASRSALAADLARVRQHAGEVEAADRQRRSRLAELEGTLLRLQRQAASTTSAGPAQQEAQLAQQRAEQRIAVAMAENEALRRQLAELDARRQAAEAGLVEAQAALAALERVEEQLWEAKGQLLLERERAAPAVPRASAEGSLPPASVSEGAHRAVVEAVLRELGGLEAALRAESAEVAALEQRLAGPASDPGV
jgi:chromosome segregation ATPase